MELTFNLEDDLSTRFVANKSKEKLNTMFKNWVKNQLANEKNEPVIREGDDEVYGMWANRDIDPLTYARELRKGRLFNVD